MSVWFWVTLWTVLAGGTIIGGALLIRWLLRELHALMAQLHEAEERHGPALIRLDAALNASADAGAGAGNDTADRRPSMFSDDLTTHYARLSALRVRRVERRAARRERHRVTWEKWARFNDPAADRS